MAKFRNPNKVAPERKSTKPSTDRRNNFKKAKNQRERGGPPKNPSGDGDPFFVKKKQSGGNFGAKFAKGDRDKSTYKTENNSGGAVTGSSGDFFIKRIDDKSGGSSTKSDWTNKAKDSFRNDSNEKGNDPRKGKTNKWGSLENKRESFKKDYKSAKAKRGSFFTKDDSSKETDKSEDSTTKKKKFDKSGWRVQRYSKKFKLDQWEDKRRKAVLRGYYKQIKDEDTNFDVQKIYDELSEDEDKGSGLVGEKGREGNAESKKGEVSKEVPKQKFGVGKRLSSMEERLREKQRLKEERERKMEEKKKALEEYKRKKQEKIKKLNRRTRKGQPVMKDRMMMLLEKIQSNMAKE